MLFRSLLVGSLLFLVAHPSASLASGQPYAFTILDTLGGNGSSASGINNAGQVVGSSYLSDNVYYHATLWNGSTIVDLDRSGNNNFSTAVAINNLSAIVGTSAGGATLWTAGTTTYLAGPNGERAGAFAINDFGQIAGFTNTSNGLYMATRWTGASATILGALGETGSLAYGINNSGKVVGWSNTPVNYGVNAAHAVLWSGASVFDLGTQGGTYGEGNTLHSFASDINNSGQIAGYAIKTSNAPYEAALWDGASFRYLGALTGAVSFANALNDNGQVVGYYGTPIDGIWHAALWDGADTFDLNDLLDASVVNAGWVLTNATAINDNGWIVGDAVNSISGDRRAFLMAPVPEPETYGMLLAGLVVIGGVATKRSRIMQFCSHKIPAIRPTNLHCTYSS